MPEINGYFPSCHPELIMDVVSTTVPLSNQTSETRRNFTSCYAVNVEGLLERDLRQLLTSVTEPHEPRNSQGLKERFHHSFAHSFFHKQCFLNTYYVPVKCSRYWTIEVNISLHPHRERQQQTS